MTRWSCALAAVLVFGSCTVAGAASDALTVAAGLGGVARHGRWLPVSIDVAPTPSTADADAIRITWGATHWHRELRPDAGQIRHVQAMLRGASVSDRVEVQLERAGVPVATTSALVSLVDDDATVVVCGSAAPAAALPADCSVTLSAPMLPIDPRAWDVADGASLDDATFAAASDEARAAYLAWAGARRTDDAGGALPPNWPAPPAEVERRITHLVVLYLVVLMAAVVWPVRRRRMLAWGPAIVIVGAVVVAISPLAMAGVRETTSFDAVVEAFPDTAVARVSARAITSPTAAGRFRLRVLDDQLAITADDADDDARAPALHTFDADGFPTRLERHALGTPVRTRIDGYYAVSPLGIDTVAEGWRVTNHGPTPLDSCHLGRDATERPMAPLAPGASTLVLQGASRHVEVRCATSQAMLPLETNNTAATRTGRTTVLARLSEDAP